MKILVINSLYPPHAIGGYEIRCKDVVDGLRKKGHEVRVVTTHCPTKNCHDHSQDLSVHRILHQKNEVRTFFFQIINDVADIRFLSAIVKVFSPDIIYLWHIDNLSNAIVPYFSDTQVRLVLDDGSSEMIFLSNIYRYGLYFKKDEHDSNAEKKIKNYVNGLINLVSKNLLKPTWSWPSELRVYFNSISSLDFAREKGALVRNAVVIRSGVETERFPFQSRHQVNNPVRIITPGRIESIKGTLDAVLLVKELIRRKIRVSLKIIGNVDDQEYYEKINQLIQELELTGAVEFTGMIMQPVLSAYYQESDFCFFPSCHKTGFSRTPLEAMASGCVVISYGNEGSREIIEDHVTGFIAPQGDIEYVSSLIEELMINSQAYRGVVESARSIVQSKYTMSRYIDSVEAYLTDTLNV